MKPASRKAEPAPVAPPVLDEKAQLQLLLVQHKGNLSAMARALTNGGGQITRQALTRRLQRCGLLAEADKQRAGARISGPRSHLRNGVADPKGEAAKLLDALATADNYGAAAKALGMGRRTLFRKVDRYGITPGKVERHRNKLARNGNGAADHAPA